MTRIKRVFIYSLDGVIKRPLEIASFFKVSKNTINRMGIGLEVGGVFENKYVGLYNNTTGVIKIERIF